MRRQSARSSAGAACAALVTAVLLAPGAAEAWTTATPVSALGINARDAEIALDSAGNTTVVWESGDATTTIRTAYRPAGGEWEPPETITPTSGCRGPELAVNANGAAALVADCGGPTTAMQGAYRPAGGAWQNSQPIPASDSGFDQRLAVDGAGNVVAVWESGSTVHSAYRPAAGTWGAEAPVSPAGHIALDPDVAMSPAGLATVIWRHDLNRTPTDQVVTVESVARLGAAAWGSAPTVLTLPATSTFPVVADEPQVAASGVGQRMAVWANTWNSIGPILPILQSRWGANSWGTVESASDAVRSVEEPQVTLSDTGGAVAVWRSTAGSGFRVQGSATPTPSGDWSAPVTFDGGETGVSVEPSVAVSPEGDATVVWRDLDSTTHAVSHSAGGAFSGSETISTTSFGNPRVAVDASGSSVATWADQASSPPRIVVAVDDVAPPVLSQIAGPAGAERGAPISLSASATDAWSEPVTLAWDFGDGATAFGEEVSHSYAAPGTVMATVTATDAAGNSARASREIAVIDPGGPGPDARLGMTVKVPKQSWKKIRKARGVKLRCTLDAAGACEAQARVSRRVGKRLGLKRRALAIGRGSRDAPVADRPTALKVKLTRAARAAIADADRSVQLKLSVDGTAPGLAPVTLKKKLRIRR